MLKASFYHILLHLQNVFVITFLIKFLFCQIFTGYEWVGWRNDTFGMAGKPVEMVFEFDSVRNFSAMILHTNNMFSKDVQVSTYYINNKHNTPS